MSNNQYSEEITLERRKRTIEAAYNLFLDNNLDSVTMQDIATASGIGVASVYRYHKTKTNILIEIGIAIWTNLASRLEILFSKPEFFKKSGYEQIEKLLYTFLTLYTEYSKELKFISEFDRYVIINKIGKELLSGYEKSIYNYYPIFEKSYLKGIADKSIKESTDLNLLFRTITHTLISMSQKFINGNVLPSDDFSSSDAELELIIKMILKFIKRKDL